ncbi:hypothetical protein PMAYCL1PPCAC_24869, partial [Pristionchus mayeri]
MALVYKSEDADAKNYEEKGKSKKQSRKKMECDEEEENEKSQFLFVNLFCLTNQTPNWSMEVTAEFALVHPDKNSSVTMARTRGVRITFIPSCNQAIQESYSFNSDGFIKDDKVTVEVRYLIFNMRGIEIVPRVDFTDPVEPRHDVALIIGGEKIYVNKGYLAIHSPVFNAMFYGDFSERNKYEVELKEIDRKEFIGLLNVLIYPSYAKITDANAGYLLKLADQFQITTIVHQVEKFLIDGSSLTVVNKLRISDQYKLIDLQEDCLDSFETIKDIKKIKDTEGYKDLSKDIKSELMDRVMKLEY